MLFSVSSKMDYGYNDKGKHHGEHRSRGSRGSRFSSRQYQNEYSDRNQFSNPPSNDNVPSQNVDPDEASASFMPRNSYAAREYTNYSKGKYGASNSKHSQNSYPRQNSKVHEKTQDSLNSNEVGATCQGYEAEPAAPKHGNIVSGRYIRKHSSQPVSQRFQNHKEQENRDFEPILNNAQFNKHSGQTSNYRSRNQKELEDRNFKSNSNTSHPQFSKHSNPPYRSHNQKETDDRGFEPNSSSSYRNKNIISENRQSQARTFSGNEQQRRNYSGKSSNGEDYSRRTPYAHSERGNGFENSFASSDVYRYSSQNANERKPFKPNRERNPKSAASSTTSYHENEATQRELLIQRLNKGECECSVCCEQIRVKDQTWHCLACYHVFHLRCIKKWARSPHAAEEDGTWGCPTCRNATSKVPYDYFCFCGKQREPPVNYHLTPHSCGEICGRKRPECTHLCKELCHPGPCPMCSVVVQKACPCGKTFKTTTCKQTVEEPCKNNCDKLLNCGVHICKNNCHVGVCQPCEETIVQECYCKKKVQTVTCTQESANVRQFSCGEVCLGQLNCGHHSCTSVCHPGTCKPCSRSPEVVKYCPCGKMSEEKLIACGKIKPRKSCMDPIPLCDQKCDRFLPCGPKDNPHTCQSQCHEGDCPKCPLATLTKCRCGAFTKEFSCFDITPSFQFLCEKRCNRRKDCGRHKCLNNCCIHIEHRCELICNKKLSCGTHQCPETCHMGNCPTCWNVSFDELRCHCGESVLYPPIHCGTKPPECSKLCIRSHPCEHEVKHTCHSDETCPPCTSLTVKWCYGHHKQCGTVMCFMDGVSCGMVCNKDLPCGTHKCKSTCHDGPCFKDGVKCTQPCSTPRLSCSHPCGNQCHEGSCPETPCKAQVTLTCPCGHRSETTTCYDSTKSYRLMSVSMLATKMQEIKDGQSVNLNDVLGKKSKNSKLQCNEQCAVIERNKRLAVALQIQNPELSTSPGPPSYSEFLKEEAKKNPVVVAEIYSKISDLVQLAKESKQKCRSHSFPPMKREHRRVVHELAEFFGCETESYDEEPKKNVVVTAHKTKCWLPFVSIMTVVQRDMGFRKGPAPVINQRADSKSFSSGATSNGQKKKIDYFEYNEYNTPCKKERFTVAFIDKKCKAEKKRSGVKSTLSTKYTTVPYVQVNGLTAIISQDSQKINMKICIPMIQLSISVCLLMFHLISTSPVPATYDERPNRVPQPYVIIPYPDFNVAKEHSNIQRLRKLEQEVEGDRQRRIFPEVDSRGFDEDIFDEGFGEWYPMKRF
ncbi:hypothetical protein JTE90_015092 [Oedothorax gibbosus]|uniref:Transcriptional repressor NF-X1 n=1 Tax=Oedothorax gibbosus TaxID=931172 RepID=A0AAV6VS19_9ARAC|nr:hypothetical protein JTE90_015092 [Oedothorax gibbosus]